MQNIRNWSQKSLTIALATAVALMGLLFFVPKTEAHTNPIGCTSTAFGIAVTIYEADGITAKVGNAQSGETLKYDAELSFIDAGGNKCNFEGGALEIVTPDGVPHDVTPLGGIPLVFSGSAFISDQVSYIVSEADAAGDGDLDVIVNYSSGISHKGDGHNIVSGSANDSTPFEDVSLTVTKTAVEVSEETFDWTINKSVSPATWDLFTGDSGTSEYTIVLDKSASTTNHSVSGTITIDNPALFATATVISVTDSITGFGAVAVVCPGDPGPYLIGPGGQLVCTYSSTLPDSSTRTNTATVTTSGDVGGGSDDETVDFTGVVPTEVNGSVSVDDTNDAGDHTPVSEDTTYKYTRIFSCDENVGINYNTAVIIDSNAQPTNLYSNANVTVRCYKLEVTKDANESLDRQYNWTIDKVGDQTNLILAPGVVFPVNYDVTVNMTGATDSDWAVAGTITVHNPAPVSATINSVSDVISGPVGATVDCAPAVFPYTLAPGGDLVCTYSASLPNGETRTNTATAVQQNYDYDSAGAPTPDDTTNVTGQASVNFVDATITEIDKCINVSDTFPELALAYADLTVCVGEDTLPKTFQYIHNVGPYTDQDCGIPQVVNNTASFVTNNTGAQGSNDHTVNVEIACTCTLTQGYWKTHSSYGPAAHPDDNWASVGGPDASFFLSGQTWIQVFKTAPKGNAYYNLAHQYMAAKLNILSGASPTVAVTNAITQAETLFGTYIPTQFNNLGKKHADRALAISLAGILGSYNEGLTGPGHCSEPVLPPL